MKPTLERIPTPNHFLWPSNSIADTCRRSLNAKHLKKQLYIHGGSNLKTGSRFHHVSSRRKSLPWSICNLLAEVSRFIYTAAENNPRCFMRLPGPPVVKKTPLIQVYILQRVSFLSAFHQNMLDDQKKKNSKAASCTSGFFCVIIPNILLCLK